MTPLLKESDQVEQALATGGSTPLVVSELFPLEPITEEATAEPMAGEPLGGMDAAPEGGAVLEGDSVLDAVTVEEDVTIADEPPAGTEVSDEAPLSQRNALDSKPEGITAGESTVVGGPVATELKDPDAEIAAAFLGGSEQAFIQLYAKYEAPLLLYCKRMLSNERIAEDAFQEIWIKVFELRSKPDIRVTHFKALLFRSARNLCLNTLRLERIRAGSSDQLMEVVASDESNRYSEQREIKALIRQALGKLPFDQREAFVLHEYSGYSYQEIAEMMGTSEVNVKVRAYRARTRLRKLIQGWLGLRESDDPSNVI